MNIKKSTGYHGYVILPRQSKLLLRVLGHGLFGFYLDLVMEASWHRGSKYFGQIKNTQAELAKKLNMEQSTISRNIKAIQKLNRYCIIKRKNYLILGFFPLFVLDVVSKISRNDYEDLHTLYADVHQINANMQEKYAFLQDERTQNASQFRDSSSEGFFSGDVNNEVDTNEDMYIKDNEIDDIDKGIEMMLRERKN
jgi:hypothetical protein